MKHTTLVAALAALTLTACAPPPGQGRYGWQDVGQATAVEFGTVLAARPVEITGQPTGLGAVGGGMAGAFAGSTIGSGNGSLAGMLAGALVAGVAAHAAEQALSNRDGTEYVVTLESGATVTVVQNTIEGEPMLNPGDRVMVQTRGGYQRVLSAAHLSEAVEKPKGVTHTKAAKKLR